MAINKCYTVLNNFPTVLQFYSVFRDEEGNPVKDKRVDFQAGFTSEVPAEIIDGLRDNPIFRKYTQSGKLVVSAIEPDADGTRNGQVLADVDDVPMPIKSLKEYTDEKQELIQRKFIPKKSVLMSMDGVAKTTAGKIYEAAVEGNYASFEHLRDALKGQAGFKQVKWDTFDYDYAAKNGGVVK